MPVSCYLCFPATPFWLTKIPSWDRVRLNAKKKKSKLGSSTSQVKCVCLAAVPLVPLSPSPRFVSSLRVPAFRSSSRCSVCSYPLLYVSLLLYPYLCLSRPPFLPSCSLFFAVILCFSLVLLFISFHSFFLLSFLSSHPVKQRL